jgi:hypothetical protein
MNIHVLPRPEWNGDPTDLGDCFRLSKEKRGRFMTSVCRLLTHPFGWELFLETNGSLQQSAVCRTEHEVFTTSEEWKTAMVEKGWSGP